MIGFLCFLFFGVANTATLDNGNVTNYMNGFLDLLYPLPTNLDPTEVERQKLNLMRFRGHGASRTNSSPNINSDIADGFVNAMSDPQATWSLWQSSMHSINKQGDLDHNPEQLIPEAMKLMAEAEKAQNDHNTTEAAKLKRQATANIKTAIDDMMKATKLHVPPEVLQNAAKQSAEWWRHQLSQVKDPQEIAAANATSQMLSDIADMYDNPSETRFMQLLREETALAEIRKKRKSVQKKLKEADDIKRNLLRLAQIKAKHGNFFDSPQDKAINAVRSVIDSYNENRQEYTRAQPKPQQTAKPKVSAIEDIDRSKTIPEAEKKILQQIS